MSSPIFFTPKSELIMTHKLRPLEQCFFNQIELLCPHCGIKQIYLMTEKKSVICDYCANEIVIKTRGKDGAFNRKCTDKRNQITVVSRR